MKNELSISNKIKPMNIGLSVFYFGIPTLITIFAFHIVMPKLTDYGFTPFLAYFFSMGMPLALMLAASIVGFINEGNDFKWDIIRKRFRLYSLSLKTCVFLFLTFICLFILSGIFLKINSIIIQTGIIPIPSTIPDWLNSTNGMPSLDVLNQAFGGLSGNWIYFFLYSVFLCINVFGEELWWRGYILPRQELAMGKGTWVIHGILWTLFHAFKWWELFTLIPVTFILSYIVWKFKNNTIGIVLHFILNGLALIPIFFLILR